MHQDSRIVHTVGQAGQATSFEELEQLVFAFEEVLKRFGIPIQSGSELERACCSVLELLGRNQNTQILDAQEDIRHIFTEVLGLWFFSQKDRSLGPIPMSVNMLYAGEFGNVHAHQRVFDKINLLCTIVCSSERERKEGWKSFLFSFQG